MLKDSKRSPASSSEESRKLDGLSRRPGGRGSQPFRVSASMNSCHSNAITRGRETTVLLFAPMMTNSGVPALVPGHKFRLGDNKVGKIYTH